MNFRYVIRQLGLLYLVLSAVMLFVAACAALLWERGLAWDGHPFWAFLASALVGGSAGVAMWAAARPSSNSLGRREALLLVAASWLTGAALAALPYWVWATFFAGRELGFSQAINCYFEAMSGLTSTGATVLTHIESLPRSVLLWRATTNWLGGLGIVVLFVAVLPTLGVGAKRLFRAETSGVAPEGVTPHIRETARVLWLIYVGFTLVQVIALRVAGMEWFNSICHTFATMATGGFSSNSHSVGGYDSLAVNVIIIVFMVLAGVNFGLYHQLIRGRFAAIRRDSELHAYFAILFVASAIVVFSIAGEPIVLTTGEQCAPALGRAIREGVFTTVSIQTTTGFCTADFGRWPILAQTVILVLMFVGGCAGSTSGGIKVTRILVVFKVMVSELERAFRPHVVRPVRVGASVIAPEVRQGALAFVFGHVLLFAVGAIALMLFESARNMDVVTAASASVACLCNVGPGFARVGPVANFDWLGPASKLLLCLWMAIGRLEVFAILVLIHPRFWRAT